MRAGLRLALAGTERQVPHLLANAGRLGGGEVLRCRLARRHTSGGQSSGHRRPVGELPTSGRPQFGLDHAGHETAQLLVPRRRPAPDGRAGDGRLAQG